MTPEERRNPNLINGSRRLRIARGAGMRTSDVNALLKQFKMMQQMMSQMSRGKRPKLPFGQLPGM
jgi:signal recognition particle subunit SRP54